MTETVSVPAGSKKKGKAGDASKACNLNAVKAKKFPPNFESFKKIDDTTRQYLYLMMKMQESPLLLNLFSRVDFQDEHKDPIIVSTELTEHFLTEGLVVYSVTSLDSGYNFKEKVNDILELEKKSGDNLVDKVIENIFNDLGENLEIKRGDNKLIDNLSPDEKIQFPLVQDGVFGVPVNGESGYRDKVLNVMHELFGTPKATDGVITDGGVYSVGEGKNKNRFTVRIVRRDSGCGFGIPKKSVIKLDPRLVWTQTKLKLAHKLTENKDETIDSSNDGVYVINKAGGVLWVQSKWETINDLDHAEFMQSNFKAKYKPSEYTLNSLAELSDSSVKIHIFNQDSQEQSDVEKAVIIMPFTCVAFDMLTEVYYNDHEEPLILFTT